MLRNPVIFTDKFKRENIALEILCKYDAVLEHKQIVVGVVEMWRSSASTSSPFGGGGSVAASSPFAPGCCFIARLL